jgi:hypothetical protein
MADLKIKGFAATNYRIHRLANGKEIPIGYLHEITGKHYAFETNNYKPTSKTIADIYKSRWQVELFLNGSTKKP